MLAQTPRRLDVNDYHRMAENGRWIANLFIFLAVLLAWAAPVAAETEFHVSKTGDDAGPGTLSRPFATLERARQAVRLADAGKTRKVIVHGGSYERGVSFILDLAFTASCRAIPPRAAFEP